jgi:hypothetical protein
VQQPSLTNTTNKPAEFHLRVPIVYSWSFHDYASPGHYAASSIPFTLPMYPNMPPTLVPVEPRTWRLPRLWQFGEVPKFSTCTEGLEELECLLDSPLGAHLPNHDCTTRVCVAKEVQNRLSHIIGIGERIRAVSSSKFPRWIPPASATDALGDVDNVIKSVNQLFVVQSTPGWKSVADLVLGILTGWSHHLFIRPLGSNVCPIWEIGLLGRHKCSLEWKN